MAVCTSWGAALETHPTIRRADRDLTITIFLAAMSRPKAERVEFVREACADDVALLAEVGGAIGRLSAQAGPRPRTQRQPVCRWRNPPGPVSDSGCSRRGRHGRRV